MKIVRILLKRPSDKQIRFLRVLFGATLTYVLFSAHGNYVLLPAIWAPYDSIAQWALLILAFPALWGGLTGICFAKKKTIRIGQLVLAVILFTLGGWLMRPLPTQESATVPAPTPVAVAPVATGSVKPAVSFAEAITAPKTTATASGNTSFDQAVAQVVANQPTPSLPAGLWISLLAWLPLVAGITGKTITSKCLKYGEKITKIRV